jgi:hypothetical protein
MAIDSGDEAGRNREIGGHACQHEKLMNASIISALAALAGAISGSIDLLRDFSETCRAEFETLGAQF